MNTEVVMSINNVPIRLTSERWNHIVARHPELGAHRARIIETVRGPDFIAKGLHGELKAVRLFIDLPTGAQHFIVLHREVNSEDGFIITALISSDICNVITGGVIWRRK
jgi:hypothetical protein